MSHAIARRRTPSASTSRRSFGRATPPRRRGLTGGWLQRRQPEPTGMKKAMRTVTHGSKSKPAVAAAGAALLAVGGLAFRRRGKSDDASTPPSVR